MSGPGRPSSTEILLQRCMAAGEVTRAEVDTILGRWKTTANRESGDRSKDLQKFMRDTMGGRATVIWQSMTNQQEAQKIAGIERMRQGGAKASKKTSVMDELLRPTEGLQTVQHPEGGDRGFMSQEVMPANMARQEAETAKKGMYESLVSVPGSGKDPAAAKIGSKTTFQKEISTAAATAAKEKQQHPVPTELNWMQFNVVDKDAVNRIIQNVNAREGIIATAATGKLLSMAVQQQACRILAAGVHHNSSRQSKDTLDDFSRIMGLSEKKGRDVYSMSFGPDVYGDLALSERNSRQICRGIGEDGERVINEEKLRHEAYLAENITKSGKRKLEEADLGSSETPWWVREGQAEEKGLADWATIAKLHVVDQVVGLDRSVGRRVVRTMGDEGSGGVGGSSSSSSGSSSSSSSNSSDVHVDEKLKLFNKIKAEFPLVTSSGNPDANVLTRQDIAGSVTDTVKNIFPSNVGFGVGSTLGKGAVRAKLRINQAPGIHLS